MKEPSTNSRASRRDSHHSHPHHAGATHGHGHGHGEGHGHVREKEKDLDSRRVKGEISCAECRRLKLKCDRKVPCTSCVRRGCAPICPTGALTAGSGTRFVLASTSSLHQQLQVMSNRIRQLEDALSISHAALGAPTSHPLLSEEWMTVKSGAFGAKEEGEDPEEKNGYEEDGETMDEELEERFGMMSVSEDGEVRFLGRAANESLLTLANDADHEVFRESINVQPSTRNANMAMDRMHSDSAPLDLQLGQLASSFPFVSPDFASQALLYSLPSNTSFTPFGTATSPPYLSHKAALLYTLESRLPALTRIKELLETYLSHISWFCTPVGRTQVLGELVPLFYASPGFGVLRSQGQDDLDQTLFQRRLEKDARTPTYTHRLALLYSLLAGGATGDLTLPLGSTEAQVYHTLAASSMGLNSVFGSVFDREVEEVFKVEHGDCGLASSFSADDQARGKTSQWKDERQYVPACGLEIVQAIAAFAMYEFCCGRRGSLEGAWKVMGCGLGLASSIGLHRDPSLLSWSSNSSSSTDAQASATIPKRLANRRRRLFWELFAIDKFRSLESGRPACFNLKEVDCAFPDAESEPKTDPNDVDGDMDLEEIDERRLEIDFRRWKHRLTKQVIAPIAEKLCAARPIKYSEVLDLDRRIREFEALPGGLGQDWSTSESLNSAIGTDTDAHDKGLGSESERARSEKRQKLLWKINCGALREIALLYVHRTYFARAMLSNPLKPLSTPYTSSVLAAYASAITLLKILRSYHSHYESMALRQWLTWAHALTSAVIIGSVAVRGPVSYVSASAWKELDAAVELFKAAQKHPVCKKGLPLLLRLQCRAEHAFKNGRGMGDIRFVLAEGAREELKIMYGATSYLNEKRSPAWANAKSKARVSSTDEKVALSNEVSRATSEESTSNAPKNQSATHAPEQEKTASDMAATDVEWSMFAPPPLKSMSHSQQRQGVGLSQLQVQPGSHNTKNVFDFQSSNFEESAFTRHISDPSLGRTDAQQMSQVQTPSSFDGTGGSLSPTEPTDPAYVSLLIENANLSALEKDLPGVFSFSSQQQQVPEEFRFDSHAHEPIGQTRGGSPSDAYDSTAWLQALSSSVSGALNAPRDAERNVFASAYPPANNSSSNSGPRELDQPSLNMNYASSSSAHASFHPSSTFTNPNCGFQSSPDINMSLSDPDFSLNELLQPYLGPGIHWSGNGTPADGPNALVDFDFVDGRRDMHVKDLETVSPPLAKTNESNEMWRDIWAVPL